MYSWIEDAVIGSIALGSFGFGTYSLVANIRFRLKALSTEGSVIGEKAKDGPEGSTEFHPVVRFKTPDGKNWTFVNKIGASMGMPKPGKKVMVLYDPERPLNARWDNFVELWMLPLVPLALGVTLLILILNDWFSR